MRRVCVLVVALTLLGCSGGAAAPSPSPSPIAVAQVPSVAPSASPAPSPELSPSQSPAPPPAAPPPAAAGQLVTCGFGGFPAADLDATGQDQDDDDPAAAALRDYIAQARPMADWIPQDGYLEVLRTPDLVLWINRNADGPVQGVARREAGSWDATVSGCQQPQTVTQGTVPATWVFAEPPDPQATVLRVLATSLECSSGEATGDRLRPPEVVETGDTVTITFTADPLPPGGYNCPGSPPTPATVELAAPLGDRAVFDGGTVPPRPAEHASEGLYG